MVSPLSQATSICSVFGEKFCNSTYKKLNQWQPEKENGKKVPECQKPSPVDLLEFSKAACSCDLKSTMQVSGNQLQDTLVNHFFDLSYKVKFKQLQCQIETLDSFDSHESVGLTSYGGVYNFRLPYKNGNQNESAKNYSNVNSDLSGSSLDSWGNGGKIIPFDSGDPDRPSRILERQKTIVDHLFQAVSAISRIGRERNADIDSSVQFGDPGAFDKCMKEAYQARVARRANRIESIHDSVWGNGIPEINKLIDGYAYFVLNPNDKSAAQRFRDQMINNKGLQGVIQDVGNRIQNSDLHMLKDEMAARRRDGRFSHDFRESLVREGYFETAFNIGTPQNTDSGFDNALLAAENLRCDIAKIYKRGPEVLEKDTAAFWYLVDALAMWVPVPGVDTAGFEAGLTRFFGKAVAKRLLVAAVQANKHRKLILVSGVGAFTTYKSMTLPDADKLAEKSLSPQISQLCFREDYTKASPVNAAPFDNLTQLVKTMNDNILNIEKDDQTDNANLFTQCRSSH